MIVNSTVLEILGRIIIFLAGVFIILLAIALFLCFYTLKTRRIIFPNFVLFIMELFYEPLNRLFSFFHIDPAMIDKILVEIGNAINYHKFAATKLEERALVLPQCIRNIDCPAKLSSVDGFHCIECGKCRAAEISAICKELGIKMYISPGGTFTKRIIMHNKLKAVIGVACYPNLYEGLLNIKIANMPAQGVPLTTTGCVNTIVNYEEILNKLLIGVEKEEEKKIKIKEKLRLK